MKIDNLPIPAIVKENIASQGISRLYPPQEEAIKAGALLGRNLVLASPTASGKTLIAELCAIQHILERRGKVLYLTPLRALTSEKFNEFKKYSSIKKITGDRVRIAISTGDFDGSDPWLSRYDVIITTNEKCDSLIRHRPNWINDVSLIVADEVHTLMDPDRGPTLEVTLTRLMEINPSAQILALSATISNAAEVSKWLNAESVTTAWRPVKLIEGVYYQGECQFNDGNSIKVQEEYKDPVINMTLQTLMSDGQVLVFANTRRRAVSYAKRIGNSVKKILTKNEKRSLTNIATRILRVGERTRFSHTLSELVKNGVAFHHAGLAAPHRRIIEDSFREGKIKVVSATPTLAAGVNLPARRVIVTSTRRYNPGLGQYDISILEYKQMAGRAGRPKYDEFGDAILVSRTEDEQDYLMERYIFSKPERIWSKLAVEKIMRSHVLASIASGFTRSEESLLHFFRQTFYAHQFDAEIIDLLVGRTLEYLYQEEMIVNQRRHLTATRFGRRVSELYIDPVSGVIIRDSLKNPPLKITDFSLLHLVCHTPDVSPKYYPRRREIDTLNSIFEMHSTELYSNLSQELDDIDYETLLGEVKCAAVLDSWIHEVSEDGIIEAFAVEPGDLFRLVSSVDWLLHATHELAKLFEHRVLLRSIHNLQLRVEKGVKEELLPLVSIEGVGRMRGRVLYNAGFKTIEDIKLASFTQLTDLPLIGPQIAKRIKEQVGGFIRSNEYDIFKGREDWEQKTISDYE